MPERNSNVLTFTSRFYSNAAYLPTTRTRPRGTLRLRTIATGPPRTVDHVSVSARSRSTIPESVHRSTSSLPTRDRGVNALRYVRRKVMTSVSAGAYGAFIESSGDAAMMQQSTKTPSYRRQLHSNWDTSSVSWSVCSWLLGRGNTRCEPANGHYHGQLLQHSANFDPAVTPSCTAVGSSALFVAALPSFEAHSRWILCGIGCPPSSRADRSRRDRNAAREEALHRHRRAGVGHPLARDDEMIPCVGARAARAVRCFT